MNPPARRFLIYLKPYKLQFLQAAFAMVMVSLATSLEMLLIKPLVDKTFIQKDTSMMANIAFLILILAFLRMAFSYLQGVVMGSIGHQAVRDLSNALFEHLQRLSLDYYHSSSTGNLMARLTRDVESVREAIVFVPAYLVRDGLMVLFLAGSLFYLNARWALAALVVFPIIYLLILNFSERLKTINRTIASTVGEIYTLLQERISGVKLIKASACEAQEIERMRRENQRMYQSQMKSERATQFQKSILEFVTTLTLAGITVGFGLEVIRGRSTPGAFFAFLACAMALYRPARSLSDTHVKIQAMNASGERIFEILDALPSTVQARDAIPMPPFKGEIRFEKVSFFYNSEVEVLRDITLSIHKGESVALVGASGAGKTTLANLLARFLDPTSGKILIDSEDIRRFSFKSLRGQIGFVTQEVFLFNDTVLNNVCYGLPEVREADALYACREARADEFIRNLPRGYHTPIGERGVLLSGGERQRLAIARALLKDPAILILDEATSALDAESEAKVSLALAALTSSRNRTTLTIAHRLSTIKNADRILVLEGGRIADEGSHKDLIATSGVYRKLYEVQFVT